MSHSEEYGERWKWSKTKELLRFLDRTPMLPVLLFLIVGELLGRFYNGTQEVAFWVVLGMLVLTIASCFVFLRHKTATTVLPLVACLLIGMQCSLNAKVRVFHLPAAVTERAVQWQERVVERYEALGFEGDELSVMAAMTVGEKSGLSHPLRQTYSITGASHVLALSGLHLGILYGVCYFLLGLLLWQWRLRWLRWLLAMVVVWGFTIMVGFTPSIVRAATMFSLFGIARCLERRHVIWNTLSLSALIALLIDPNQLYGLSFQLSYMAVIAILLFYAPLANLCAPDNRVLRYVVDVLIVSLAAQVGVAPLIMRAFSHFSTDFLFTSLLVIPAATVILLGTILLWCCAVYAPLQQLVANILQWVIRLQNHALQGIAEWRYASLPVDDYRWSDVVMWYLIAGCILLFLRHRKVVWLKLFLFMICLQLGLQFLK